jgi:hypothetical protein
MVSARGATAVTAIKSLHGKTQGLNIPGAKLIQPGIFNSP